MSTYSLTRKKRSQCDYTLAFKLQVISAVERGELSYKQAQSKYGIQGRSTVLVWLRKHGTLDWKHPKVHQVEQSPEQRIKELEQQLASAQKKLQETELKARLLDTIIEVAEGELGIEIRKKPSPKQSKSSGKKRK